MAILCQHITFQLLVFVVVGGGDGGVFEKLNAWGFCFM